MDSKTAFSLTQEWDNKRLPIINGIVYPNGQADFLDIVDCGNRCRKIVFDSKSDLNKIMENGRLLFTPIYTFYKTADFENSMIVSCGGGSDEADGFISVEIYKQKAIKWIAFFYDSEPFRRVDICNNQIHAYNTSDLYGLNTYYEKWIIDMDDPTNIDIQNLQRT